MNKFTVPFKILVPVKVAVPAEAVKLPLTSKTDDIVKLDEVLILPGILRLKKLSVPADEIVLEVPFIVILPADAVRLALEFMVILPVTIKSEVVLIVPGTIRLLKVIPVPDIVLVAPDDVNVPPDVCVNVPVPDVVRLPDTEIAEAAAAEIFAPEMVRLLKLCVPVVEHVFGSCSGPTESDCLCLVKGVKFDSSQTSGAHHERTHHFSSWQ